MGTLRVLVQVKHGVSFLGGPPRIGPRKNGFGVPLGLPVRPTNRGFRQKQTQIDPVLQGEPPFPLTPLAHR